jgi:phytoene dehydrogenase-like protein
MTGKPVIVIGAGLAGLAAGIYAQMNGYQSRIFEHHFKPGGVAAAWRRGEYLIDGGIHFVMSHKPGTGLYELYRQLGIVPGTRFVDLPGYGRFIHEPSGTNIVLGTDLDRIGDTLKSLSPADSAVVDDLIAGSRALVGFDMSQMGIGRPPELMSPLDWLRELWSMRKLLRFMAGKHGRTVAAYGRSIRDPVLRACVERLFLPDVPVYFIFMILGLLAGGEMGLITGGCPEFVGAMEKRYRALGGTVTYGATVDEVLVENDRAVGVRLVDGTEHAASAVISAADGRSTIFKMLGGRYLNEKIQQRYETWELFRPLLMVSYGVAREFPGEVPFGTVVLDEPITVGQRSVGDLFYRIFNYSPHFAPPGKTVVQASLDTEWDYWNDLQRRDRAQYDAAKERIAHQVLQRLERHYPGLSSQVEVTDVVTPYTFWRYTLNHEGAWEGWLMTAKAMRTMVERTLPGLSDFYMAGQWVMPGGGVPSCLYSGRHAIQLLCRQDGKGFQTAQRDQETD